MRISSAQGVQTFSVFPNRREKLSSDLYAGPHFSFDVRSQRVKELWSWFQKEAQKTSFDSTLKSVEALSDHLSLPWMEELAGKDLRSIVEEAKALSFEAEFYLKAFQRPARLGGFQRQGAVDALKSFLDTMILALGVKDLFDPSVHESFKFQKIMLLLTLFTVTGASFGGRILQNVLLGFGALSLCWPKVRPMPSYLPPYSPKISRQNSPPLGRKETLDQMASLVKMGRHMMLTGPSRVGKSLTAKAFAHAIERGDYPELTGMAVFYFNTADLIDHYSFFTGGASKILNEISTAMGRHRNRIILVLDEIHMACKGNQKLGEQLKVFLDEGGAFPHVIGITTDQEYESHVLENWPFAMRFDRLPIESMGEEETLTVLGQELLQHRLHPFFKEKDVLKYIYEISSQQKFSLQPASSLRLLRECIHQNRSAPSLPAERKWRELSQKIQTLCVESILEKDLGARGKIPRMKERISRLKAQLSVEQKQAQFLKEAIACFHQATYQMYEAAVKVSKISGEKFSSRQRHQIHSFVLLKALRDSLEVFLQEESQKVDEGIDRKKIDALVRQSLLG